MGQPRKAYQESRKLLNLTLNAERNCIFIADKCHYIKYKYMYIAQKLAKAPL